MKVLLLNPPAPRKIFRDQYCSHTSKTGYYWQPIDLLLQSGILASRHEVEVLDAVVEELSRESALARVRASRPEAIVALSSVLTARDDLEFLKTCKSDVGCRVIMMGDLFYFRSELMIGAEAVDAICLQYPSRGILDYLAGADTAEDMVFRRPDGTVHHGRASKGPVSYPLPKHFAFANGRYRNPLARYSPCYLVTTNFGCPFNCSYCTSNPVAFRERPLEDLFAELDYLKGQGAKEIWFRDYMFNANLERAKGICRELLARDYGFSWFSLARPDRVDEELLDLMARSGCHTIMYGVESGNHAILEANNRRTDLDSVREAFASTRKRGMLALGHFILGLPGETRDTAIESIAYLCSLDCDYLSLNIFTPRCGSKYTIPYKTLDEALTPQPELDSAFPTRSFCELPLSELKRLKRYALRRFYLRPKTLFRLAKGAGSLHQLNQYAFAASRMLTGR